MKCKKCSSEYTDGQEMPIVCIYCGESFVTNLIQAINKSKESLRQTYRRCFDTLKIYQKNVEPDPLATTFKPQHPVNLEFINSLPDPKVISPLDVFAFAVSISRHRMECFYQIKLCDSVETLGSTVNSEILFKFEDIGDSRQIQPLLFFPASRFLPLGKVSEIIEGELAFYKENGYSKLPKKTI